MANEQFEIGSSRSGATSKAIGEGYINLQLIASDAIRDVQIKVFYAPEMESNFISASTLLDKGFKINRKEIMGL